ncbi:transcriptional regulator [Providencia rustigianii]|uniref:transcriptional regulator n=1 Tax=Providencia rustigianii TaxID=158850 RepID=UPI002240AC25|nr:transcriptional regulator [Providencia rustigianii]
MKDELSGLTARDRRRLKRQKLGEQYRKENGLPPSFYKTKTELQGVDLDREVMGRADKAIKSPSVPRDHEPKEDIPKDDIMNRVVNHAHQRKPGKKW